MAVLCAAGAMLGLGIPASSALAATTVYPAGGGAFSGGAEGWAPGSASCAPVALACEAEGAYDGTAGNPAGSISARTTLTVNLINLFSGSVSWSSPQFAVPTGTITGASVQLDRAFSAGNLTSLQPTATYTVKLHDVTAGTEATVLSEGLTSADSAFAHRSAPVSVTGGHAYRLNIDATTGQDLLALSLLSGVTDARFDNVALAVQTTDGPAPGSTNDGKGGTDGKGGKSGSGKNGNGGKTRSSLDSRLLTRYYRSGVSRSARMKGNRLFVKVHCPKRIGRACRITAQGFLTKRRAATRKRTVKVPKGKGKQIVLRVKPRLRRKVAKRRTLLVREKVRAGKAHATVQRRRKLIRRR